MLMDNRLREGQSHIVVLSVCLLCNKRQFPCTLHLPLTSSSGHSRSQTSAHKLPDQPSILLPSSPLETEFLQRGPNMAFLALHPCSPRTGTSPDLPEPMQTGHLVLTCPHLPGNGRADLGPHMRPLIPERSHGDAVLPHKAPHGTVITLHAWLGWGVCGQGAHSHCHPNLVSS